LINISIVNSLFALLNIHSCLAIELREGSVSYAICIPVGDAQRSLGQIVNICGQLDIISDHVIVMFLCCDHL